MPTTCCVVKCGSRGDRDSVKFYKLPSEKKFAHRTDLNDLSKRRRQKWIQAIRRADLTETKLKYIRVCSKHFLSGKPADLTDETSPDWVPSLIMGYGKDEDVNKSHKTAADRLERAHKRRKISDTITETITKDSTEIAEAGPSFAVSLPLDNKNEKESQTILTKEDLTDIMLSLESTKKLATKIKKLELSRISFKNNDIKTKYYTGLNTFKKLEIVVNYLQEYVPVHHNTSLPVFEQVLLTFIKLRLNLDFKDLAYRFGISPTTASTYFRNVIDVMDIVFKKCILWPERDILKKSMPKCFIESFKGKVTIIIDCFEIQIEKPSSLEKSAICWSHYKHHHTLKYLIGITPQGTISFISDAYGGRASDKYVTINSKFLDNIKPGDVILADRGFLVKDYVRLLNAELQIPAFTKGKKQLHPIDVEKTRAIANVRIHVERIIGCIRQKYTILSHKMSMTLLACGDDDPIVDKIVTVCCALINICPPIVPME